MHSFNILLTGMIAAIAAVVVVPAVAEEASATETFTVVSGLPPGHPAVTIFREHFRALVEAQVESEHLGITVKWRPAYDGTIARRGEVLEAIADGIGDIGIIAVDYETRRLPLQGISFHLPFVTTECIFAADAYHSLHKNSVDMNKPWRDAGQIYLANMTTDGYGLFTTNTIKSVEELRGMTVAVADRIEPWLSGLDALPHRMPLGQLAGALDDETVNAAILPITELAGLNLGTQLDNLLLTEFGPQTAYVISIREQRFAALPEGLREALLAASDLFVPVGAQAFCDVGASLLAETKQAGLRTQPFFRSRREQWVTALPPLGQMWARDRESDGYAGGEILKSYMDYLRDAGAKPKRNWDTDLPFSN